MGLRGLEPPTLRLSGVRSNHLSYKPMLLYRTSVFLSFALGGDEEDRTPDPLLARQVLSQLSYTPIYQSASDGASASHLFEGFGPSKLNNERKTYF